MPGGLRAALAAIGDQMPPDRAQFLAEFIRRTYDTPVDSKEDPRRDALLAWAEARPWLSDRPWLLWRARTLALAPVTLIVLHWRGPISGPWWLLPMAAGLWLSHHYREQLVGTLDRAFWRERVLCHYEKLFQRLAESRAVADPRGPGRASRDWRQRAPRTDAPAHCRVR
jgi:hypothetical protein